MELRATTNKKRMVGVVVKDKMDKTVVIETERVQKHPKYHKYLKTRKRYKAHDEENACKVGDKVVIVEARPISSEKKWVVKGILKKEEPILIREEVEADDTGAV